MGTKKKGKKELIMRKNSFIEGTIVATLGIIIVKVIGLLYVIPFNAIIGEQGGALYGYGYNIYQLFLGISSAGFPFAISKITSEYNALGYNKAIKDTYAIALKIISIISFIAFIILFIFAPNIGRLIIGKTTEGITYSDIGFVIRCVSFAILVIPFLSVTRGFLQGHKYITQYSISQIIEQIVRVIIILVGSFFAIKVFNLPIKYAVGIAVSAAFFGGVVSYIYLRIKINKNHLLPKGNIKDEVNINKEEIIKKIFTYSIPFILISIVNNLYINIDMILLSRTMTDILTYSNEARESIVGIYTTWGLKLNSIILAVSTGLVTSLIPNIVSSFTKNDMDDVNNKFNKALQCVLLVIIPITLFFSLLSEPIWTLFYGESYYGPIVFKVYVFTALFGGIYTILVNTLQGINKYKLVTVTVAMGLIINGLLDVPLMILADKLHMNVSYGAIFAAFIGYSSSIFTTLYLLHKKYDFKYKETINILPKYILSWIIFIISILLLKLIIPTNINSRLLQIPILASYGIISFGIYIYLSYKNGNLQKVFGNAVNKIIKKIKN